MARTGRAEVSGPGPSERRAGGGSTPPTSGSLLLMPVCPRPAALWSQQEEPSAPARPLGPLPWGAGRGRRALPASQREAGPGRGAGDGESREPHDAPVPATATGARLKFAAFGCCLIEHRPARGRVESGWGGPVASEGGELLALHRTQALAAGPPPSSSAPSPRAPPRWREAPAARARPTPVLAACVGAAPADAPAAGEGRVGGEPYTALDTGLVVEVLAGVGPPRHADRRMAPLTGPCPYGGGAGCSGYDDHAPACSCRAS